MAFTIPQPIKNLNAPLAAVASRSYSDPREGKQFIPIEIDWDGAGSTLQINVQGRTTTPFSQIIMLDVDNTNSGADATFYFPDSTDTLVVPAYSAGLFPVFTQGLLFYAAATAALATDITRLRVLNYLQQPVGNPAPQFHNIANGIGVAVAAGTTALIPAGTSGTLVAISLQPSVAAAAAASVTFTLKDHATGNVITGCTAAFGAPGNITSLLTNLTNIAVRFASGIDLTQVLAGAPTGNITATLAYRTP